MNEPYQVGPGPGVEPADAVEARGALGLVGRDLAGPAVVPRGVARLGGGERGPVLLQLQFNPPFRTRGQFQSLRIRRFTT